MILSVCFLALLSGGLTAQNSVSIFSGVHQSNIKTNGINMDFLDFNSLTSFHAGAYFERELSKGLSAKTGLVFTQKGFGISESTAVNVFGLDIPLGFSVDTRINTVDVPLSLSHELISEGNVHPYVTGGLNISYASSAEIRTRANSILDFTLTNTKLDLSSSAFNRWSAEAMVGAGVKIDKGNNFYMAEIGYTHGLNDFTNENSTIIDAGIRNYSVNLSVGYGIRF